MKYPPSKECFGYRSIPRDWREECTALNELVCATQARCPFYKPKKQAVAEWVSSGYDYTIRREKCLKK